MTRQLPSQDPVDWYRQFWPWFLILLPASVVVAAVLSAIIASRGADDLVVDDYYKNGLAINADLERQHRAQALGLAARLRFTDALVSVTLDGPVTDQELSLLLTHPMEADRDFSVTLTRVGPQAYAGTLARPVAARWHWSLEQQRGGWRIDGTVQQADIDDVPRN